jgi:hypothetical protein
MLALLGETWMTHGATDGENVESFFVLLSEQACEHGLVLACEGSGQLDLSLQVEGAARKPSGEIDLSLQGKVEDVGIQGNGVQGHAVLSQGEISLAGDSVESGHGKSSHPEILCGPLGETGLEGAFPGNQTVPLDAETKIHGSVDPPL